MQTQITTYNNWMKMLSDEGNNNIRSIKDAAITDGSILVSILRTFILTTTAIIINWTSTSSKRTKDLATYNASKPSFTKNNSTGQRTIM